MFDRPLTALGFTPADDVDGLQATARQDATGGAVIQDLRDAEQWGWWRTGPAESDNDRCFARIAKADRAATSIRAYTGTLIPGVLQTHAYTCAVLRGVSPSLSNDDVIARADQRSQRLDAIHPRSNGVGSLRYIIDEGALSNVVGSLDILRDQLGHLLVTLARRNDIRVQVLPADIGAHPGSSSSFILYDFGTRQVVFLEGLTGASWSVRPSCVGTYGTACEDLMAAALSVDDSLELISQRLAEAEILCRTAGSPGGEPAATRALVHSWTSRRPSMSSRFETAYEETSR
nr:DUF5753 domain-containing protein [Streptomyces sp. SID3343]